MELVLAIVGVLAVIYWRRIVGWLFPTYSSTGIAARVPAVDAAVSEQWKKYLQNLEYCNKRWSEATYSNASVIGGPCGHFFDYPSDSVIEDEVPRLLSGANLSPPFGIDALIPPPIPAIPDAPGRPNGPVPSHLETDVRRLEAQISEKRQTITSRYDTELGEFERSKARFVSGDAIAVSWTIVSNFRIHYVPPVLRGEIDVAIDAQSRVCLCTINVPDLSRVPIVKKGKTYKNRWPPVSAAQRKRLAETILYSLCLRAAYLAAACDAGNWYDLVAVNARQSWIDAATGTKREGIVASLQAQKAEMLALKLSEVDPKVCFRHLRGLATPSIENVSPVRPIFVLNTNDGRVIDGRDVAEELEPESNLASMPWDDFEHLVRQLFEWEFGGAGVEVKVTRASRDRGVDAIVFDPDPIRGGKYVIQAKRYTRTVDVAAVRDLYGTVMNEGANRGILVTTSSYGPDSYEFAKDKPISLVDGPNLLARLAKHGRRYRIDLDEARRAEGE